MSESATFDPNVKKSGKSSRITCSLGKEPGNEASAIHEIHMYGHVRAPFCDIYNVRTCIYVHVHVHVHVRITHLQIKRLGVRIDNSEVCGGGGEGGAG